MQFPLPAPMLEFLILGYLEKRDSYGYEICQSIKQVQAIKEPVLYPILKKLQKEGFISSYEQSIQSRRRKYYSLQPEGRQRLEDMRSDWQQYKAGIDAITEKEQKEENHPGRTQ